MKCIWCQKEYVEYFSLETLLTLKKELPVCWQCRELFHRIDMEKVCKGCGRESTQNYCSDCQKWIKKEGGMTVQNQALFHYDSCAKEWIKRYKFQGDCQLAYLITAPLKKYLKAYQGWTIVPIPSSKASLQARAFEAVKYIVQLTSVAYVDCLIDIRQGKKQSDKTREERLKLVQPFKIKGSIPGSKILLIDDVYTTGTTLHRAAELFKRQNQVDVKSVTIFR